MDNLKEKIGFYVNFKFIPTLIALISFFVILLIPHPAELSDKAWLMFAIFIATMVGIIGKAASVGVMALFAITMITIFKASAPKITNGVAEVVTSKQAIQDALASFSNELIWLIVISIIISRAIIKTHLGERIAYWFISAFGKKTLGIGYALAMSETVLSPITPSNTARAGAIIHPIMKAIAFVFGSDPEKGTQNKIGKYLALVNMHGNPISSAIFVTATAPNPLMVDYINKVAGTSFHLTWGVWAYSMLIPGLAAMLLMPLIIYWLSPPEIKKTPAASQFAKEKMRELGKISKAEKMMIGIFVLLLLLWADIPSYIFGKSFVINPTATAIIGLFLVILTGILSWEEAISEKAAWNTLFWFSGLVMMAEQLNKHGIIKWFSNTFQVWLENMHFGSFAVFILLICVFLYTHYFFASTTAHISAMGLAFLMVGAHVIQPSLLIPFFLMMIAAGNIMMGLTHFATGTSPIIFGSNFVGMGEWWKVGFIMSVINLIVFGAAGAIWWKILGYY